jgi:hypothetical protein
VHVRVYSPTIDQPAFEATGDLVSLPSLPIPLRPEYRISLGLTAARAEGPRGVRPNIVHVIEPRYFGASRGELGPFARNPGDRLGPHSVRHLSRLLQPAEISSRSCAAILRRLYRPLRRDRRSLGNRWRRFFAHKRMNRDITIWTRGVRPGPSSIPSAATWSGAEAWAFGDDEFVVLFLGRIVMEKALERLF